MFSGGCTSVLKMLAYAANHASAPPCFRRAASERLPILDLLSPFLLSANRARLYLTRRVFQGLFRRGARAVAKAWLRRICSDVDQPPTTRARKIPLTRQQPLREDVHPAAELHDFSRSCYDPNNQSPLLVPPNGRYELEAAVRPHIGSAHLFLWYHWTHKPLREASMSKRMPHAKLCQTEDHKRCLENTICTSPIC